MSARRTGQEIDPQITQMMTVAFKKRGLAIASP
jgi:hypothetical protein